MIAWLEGVLREKSPSRVVLAAGGVGYEAWIPLGTFAALPETGKVVALHVHTVVREDAILLYGFATPLERSVFELLLRVNGVGPRVALALLSGLEPARCLEALRDGGVAVLRGVPGVGPRTAERLVVELRDRAGALLTADTGRPAGASASDETAGADGEEAVSALVNLGFTRPQAERLVRETVAELGPDTDLESCLRAALRRGVR